MSLVTKREAIRLGRINLALHTKGATTMTQKDFILLASIILRLPTTPAERRMIAESFSKEIEKTHPRFKPELFVQAAIGEVSLNARRAV